MGLAFAPHHRQSAAMRIALFEPEIAGNVGAVMRTGACLGVEIHLIEPLGFQWEDKRVRRAAMDYIDHVRVIRHPSFAFFREAAGPGRLVLFTTKSSASIYDFTFAPSDILLFGKESAGVPSEISDIADARVRIPMRPEVRSMNLATSASIAVAEALRQTGGLP